MWFVQYIWGGGAWFFPVFFKNQYDLSRTKFEGMTQLEGKKSTRQTDQPSYSWTDGPTIVQLLTLLKTDGPTTVQLLTLLMLPLLSGTRHKICKFKIFLMNWLMGRQNMYGVHMYKLYHKQLCISKTNFKKVQKSEEKPELQKESQIYLMEN